MKPLTLAALFLPQEALPPLLALSGVLWIVGLRKASIGLIGMVVLIAMSPVFEPLIDQVFAAMPWWFSLAFIVGLVMFFAGRFLRDVMVRVLGDLICACIKFVFSSPLTMASALAALTALWLVFL